MQNGGKKKEELRDSEIIEETHQKQFIEQMQVLEKQVLHDIFSDDEEEEEAEDNEQNQAMAQGLKERMKAFVHRIETELLEKDLDNWI